MYRDSIEPREPIDFFPRDGFSGLVRDVFSKLPLNDESRRALEEGSIEVRNGGRGGDYYRLVRDFSEREYSRVLEDVDLSNFGVAPRVEEEHVPQEVLDERRRLSRILQNETLDALYSGRVVESEILCKGDESLEERRLGIIVGRLIGAGKKGGQIASIVAASNKRGSIGTVQLLSDKDMVLSNPHYALPRPFSQRVLHFLKTLSPESQPLTREMLAYQFAI